MIIFEIESTQVETIIKFKANKVLTKNSYQYNNIDEAKESPLAQQLFHLPFVKKILISANFIAIERFSIVEWKDVQNEVKEQLENYLNGGGILIKKEENKKKVPAEVYAESTPNPAVMKFVANKLLVEHNMEFKNTEEAKSSPLATELFKFPFVKEVFMSKNYISVTKNPVVEWNEITMELREFIRSYLVDNKVVVLENAGVVNRENSEIDIEDLDEISQKIISILDEYIKPAVMADGGNIGFKSYNEETQTVSVILQGACSGCPSSTITLKNGIQNTLQQMLPNKVKEVIAINQ